MVNSLHVEQPSSVGPLASCGHVAQQAWGTEGTRSGSVPLQRLQSLPLGSRGVWLGV